MGIRNAAEGSPPRVGVVMGSKSDWDTMRHACDTLAALGVPYEARVVSAHRTPGLLVEYGETAEQRGLEVIVAGAGGAAHLPGMLASHSALPVLGVPVKSRALNGLDSLLSIAQMPGGVPVGTLAIGKSGAKNAALLACTISGAKYPELREAYRAFRAAQTEAVLEHPDPERAMTTIGILGGGQLGRMLALAGHPLGHRFVVLTPDEASPAAPVAETLIAAYDDVDALAELAARCDVVTYEFENVPTRAIEVLDGRVPVRPGGRALEVASDRLAEKALFGKLGIPTPPYMAVDAAAALDPAVRHTGLPAVLKTRRLGYDGKGQRVLQTPKDVEGAFTGLGAVPQILEGFVDFRRELSLVATRGLDGTTAFYPLVENRHEGGVLRLTRAPAPELDPGQQARAESYATRLLEELDYVGVLSLELFDDGVDLLANEIAPRVHNSGHWTIEGAETSQFENHLRAITGAPLGSCRPRGESAMIDLIGEAPDPLSIQTVPGAHLHLYDKQPRPGRKLGHVTVTAENASTLDARVERL